jgi:hypothetical protein
MAPERAEIMKELVRYQLDDGSVLTAEVEVSEDGQGTARISRRVDGLVQDSPQRFEDVALVARKAATALIADLSELAQPPSQITIMFGLKLSGSLGAVIAATSAEANFGITMTWDRGATDADSK